MLTCPDQPALVESTLYGTLAELDLLPWMPVIATLMLHFQGIEEVLEEGELPPLTQLVTLVEEIGNAPARWRPRMALEGIKSLPMWCHHARNESGVWNPLAEPLSCFRTRGHTALWRDDLPRPAPAVVERWLQQKLASATHRTKRR